MLNALCYAELASRFPAVVGGAYLYTYAAFNEITAFLVFTQLMVDYHIGAASIARSLASYFIEFLELIPFLKGQIPSWVGHGEEFFGGVVSINILAPVLLIILTAILCYGVKESSAVNTFMTTLKVRLLTCPYWVCVCCNLNLLIVELARRYLHVTSLLGRWLGILFPYGTSCSMIRVFCACRRQCFLMLGVMFLKI